MESPQLHHYDHVRPIAHKIAEALTPRFPLANKPTPTQLREATVGTSFWRLAKLVFRDRLPRDLQ